MRMMKSKTKPWALLAGLLGCLCFCGGDWLMMYGDPTRQLCCWQKAFRRDTKDRVNDGKVVGGIYDDRFLVKPVKSAVKMMQESGLELPYLWAKEDDHLLTTFILLGIFLILAVLYILVGVFMIPKFAVTSMPEDIKTVVKSHDFFRTYFRKLRDVKGTSSLDLTGRSSWQG